MAVVVVTGGGCHLAVVVVVMVVLFVVVVVVIWFLLLPGHGTVVRRRGSQSTLDQKTGQGVAGTGFNEVHQRSTDQIGRGVVQYTFDLGTGKGHADPVRVETNDQIGQ